MRPMSLFESGQSNGEMSLGRIMGGERQTGLGTHLTFEELVRCIVVGGWPELVDTDEAQARRWLRDYLANIFEIDIQKLESRRDPGNLRRLLESLGRSVGRPTNAVELAKDIGGEGGPIAGQTISAYLNVLNRLHLLDNSEAWLPNRRSQTRMRHAPVLYFVDPSLGPATLGIGTAELMADLGSLGLHFKALAIRDLRVYAQFHDARVKAWCDSDGSEVDAVVAVGPNKWGAFQIKLIPEAVDKAAASLLRFKSTVATSRHSGPACLGVITSTGAGGLREDGVHVIPIGCLGP